jgi:hypothetical protein
MMLTQEKNLVIQLLKYVVDCYIIIIIITNIYCISKVIYVGLHVAFLFSESRHVAFVFLMNRNHHFNLILSCHNYRNNKVHFHKVHMTIYILIRPP